MPHRLLLTALTILPGAWLAEFVLSQRPERWDRNGCGQAVLPAQCRHTVGRAPDDRGPFGRDHRGVRHVDPNLALPMLDIDAFDGARSQMTQHQQSACRYR